MNRSELLKNAARVCAIMLCLCMAFAGCKKDYPTYIAEFNSNGGSAVESQIVKRGGKVTKPENPTKPRFTFVGWFKEASMTTEWKFDVDIVNSDITLYAKWSENFSVTFHSNEGSPVAPQTVAEGGKVNKPDDPTREGYRFSGWFKDNDTFSFVWHFENDNVTDDVILYAKWTQLFTVIFYNNEGSPVAPQTVAEGGKANKPDDPTREGYRFDGWYEDDEVFELKWDFVTVVIDNMTLHAKWTQLFTVNFNTNGGSDAPESQTVAAGNKAIAPAVPAKTFTGTLTVAGLYNSPNNYVFDGWFAENEVETFDFDTPVTQSFTVTAKWSEPAPIQAVTANNMNLAFSYINNAAAPNGPYLLLIDSDITSATNNLNQNRELTIRGLGSERTIQYNGAIGSPLFEIRNINASLILGDKITLKGINNGQYSLVFVYLGNLIMKPGSKITGHSHNAVTLYYGGVQSNHFLMEGGEISGNTGMLGDVYMSNMSNGTFTLKGDAVVGSITLAARSIDDIVIGNTVINSTVTISSNWTGSVSNLNLYGWAISDIDAVIGAWYNATAPNTVLNAELGYTLTSADVARFPLGNFIAYDTSTQPINDVHKIADSGSDIGKLVTK